MAASTTTIISKSADSSDPTRTHKLYTPGIHDCSLLQARLYFKIVVKGGFCDVCTALCSRDATPGRTHHQRLCPPRTVYRVTAAHVISTGRCATSSWPTTLQR